MIDTYSLRARVYPVVIFLFPVLIISAAYSIEFSTYVGLFSSFGLFGVLSYLLSQLGRDRGKQKEPALWQYWGGAPTSQILSFSNNKIDPHTKSRYHNKLQQLCPVNPVPTEAIERTNSFTTNESYKAWTKFLISKTRSIKDYPLLFKDNTSYGFRRNLWGLKIHSIIFICILMVLNYVIWMIKLDNFNPVSFPNSFIISCLLLLMLLIFWMIIVTRSWVKIPAFSYAERLLEATETL
jgi:hypothetical protein